MSPDCELGECEIRDLVAEVGECTGDGTYTLTLDFIHENTGNEFFDVFLRNNMLFDFYRLEELPLTITNFPMSGVRDDFIRICINDNPDCCMTIEVASPDCGG